jgi:predicted protein tyrosine phosphatase
MPRLHVCSLARLAATAETVGARSLMTLLSPTGVVAPRPQAVRPEHHLVVGVSDIVAPQDGFTQPEAAHVAQMLAFFRSWDREHPMLIHCYAGVSRSTAAAFIGVCALAPGRHEAEIATALRRASPTATPNARLVGLADAALNRSGRMIAAIQAIGRGAECFEGEPFGLDLAAPP